MKKNVLLSVAVLAYALIVAGLHTPPVHGFANSAPTFNCMSCHPGPMRAEMAKIDKLPAYYKPGKTYNLTLTLSSPLTSVGEQQGGFALEASAGELIVTDQTKTQLSNGILTHTLEGATLRSWSFAWRAPGQAEPRAAVSLTVMGLVANGDFSPVGDETGATSFTIKSQGGR